MKVAESFRTNLSPAISPINSVRAGSFASGLADTKKTELIALQKVVEVEGNAIRVPPISERGNRVESSIPQANIDPVVEVNLIKPIFEKLLETCVKTHSTEYVDPVAEEQTPNKPLIDMTQSPEILAHIQRGKVRPIT